uniref:Uncharacterized protein n=1 Tax=Arundo donax TaxID=35708 RepID=A0A0A9B180_ARUDO
MFMLPLESVLTATIFTPHIVALARFVPYAKIGMMQTSRRWSPFD